MQAALAYGSLVGLNITSALITFPLLPSSLAFPFPCFLFLLIFLLILSYLSLDLSQLPDFCRPTILHTS